LKKFIGRHRSSLLAVLAIDEFTGSPDLTGAPALPPLLEADVFAADFTGDDFEDDGFEAGVFDEGVICA
jgi:hypothetical protein